MAPRTSLRREEGHWALGFATALSVVLAAGLLVAAVLEEALLSRAAAEWALMRALQSATRALDPSNWPGGPLPGVATTTFRTAVLGSGFTPSSFATYSSGQVDGTTGFTFPAAGVGGCLTYSVWLLGPQRLCADEVTYPAP